MKKLLLLLLISATGFSQPISHYKYVIVPSKLDAQKKAGQFGLNNLTKLFLEKNGYTVFYDTDILPPEVSGESCNKIYANVYDDNTMLKTKLRFEVKDCRNTVLFVSDYGVSAEKDNHVAYTRALRDALKSFDKPEYRYDPSAAKESTVKVIEAVAPPKPNAPNVVETIAGDANLLSAQRILNGYQLVDTTPKIVMRILETSQPDVFLADVNGKNGVVLKKNGQWVFEYYENKQRIVEPLNIKF